MCPPHLSRRSCLAIYGAAGSGKSVVASALTTGVAKELRPHAFHFCKHNDRRR